MLLFGNVGDFRSRPPPLRLLVFEVSVSTLDDSMGFPGGDSLIINVVGTQFRLIRNILFADGWYGKKATFSQLGFFFWGGAGKNPYRESFLRMVILFVDLFFPQVLGQLDTVGPYRRQQPMAIIGLPVIFQTSSIQDRTKALEQQEPVELGWL